VNCEIILGASYSDNPSWHSVASDEAYDFFFLKLGNGRDLATFCNSLRNTRDEFDYFLDEVTTRVGHKKKNLPPLRESVLNEMNGKTRAEIWSYVSRFGKALQEVDIISDIEAIDSADTDTIVGSTEGQTRFRILRTRERDPKLRREAIAIHGLNCKACDFNFGDVYGEWGEGFIEIHHSTPISDYSTEGLPSAKHIRSAVDAKQHKQLPALQQG
jgi:hypothetical protein